MTDTLGNKRAVSIAMKDFLCDPESVKEFLGHRNVEFRKLGDPVGGSSVVKKNSITVWELTNALESWDDPIVRLVDRLGGFKKLSTIIEEVSPKLAWLQIDLPVIGSPYVETNRISPPLVKEIAAIGLGFSVEIFEFDPAEISHHT